MTGQATQAPGDLAKFEEILEHLRRNRGFDFTAYKRTSLLRRAIRRMQAVGVATFDAYLDYLQAHPDEFSALFNTILINVTSFFRDRDVWTCVADQVLPGLLQASKGGVLRVWSAGCAGGQEAYTIAMLIAERFGEDTLRERVKIYATDVDEEALAEARAAIYPARQLADVPEGLIEKYFDRAGTHATVRRELRRSVIFGRHDLLQEAPISRTDLLVCRNTLMYFQGDAQARILARFYFSLNPGGYLLLGRAEMLFSHAATFAATDLKRRVFQAVPKPTQRDRRLLLAQTGRDVMPSNMSNQARLREATFESDLIPHVVLDTSGLVAAVSRAARTLFGLSKRDIGRPLQDLEVSYPPVELRAAIARALEEQREVTIQDVPWHRDSEIRYFDVTSAPLFDDDQTAIGTRISFRDVTERKSLQDHLTHSRQELETVYEELQSTNEELETTSEELRSTVEELETTNEELQSINEELQTMNDELRNRSVDLNSANAFLQSIVGSLRWAVVVLDRELRVQVWNQRATDLWGLRADDAQGAHFLSLEIGLPVGELGQAVRNALSGADAPQELVLAATNRRGRAIECRVNMAPLRQGDQSVRGVILLMDDASGVDATAESPARKR